MTALNIAFRTDATCQIGTGHFMRCLTLADGLKQHRVHIRFVSRDLPDHLCDMLSAKGIEFSLLDNVENEQKTDHLAYSSWLGASQEHDAKATIQALSDISWDWLVVDHYELDITWESMLRPHTSKIMVIDDLANRVHDCDLLLDQNYYRDQDQRYQGLVPDKCVMLLGPKYVLLRPEFGEARQRLRVRDGSVRNILIFFGGSDPTNQTKKVLEALKFLDRPDIKVDVVVGSVNPNRNIIQTLCDELSNVAFHCQVSNMAELILNSDLGIGAGGAAMWERCYLGLPTITVVFAANQLRTTEDVAEIGAIEYLGWSDQLSSRDYANAISGMLEDSLKVRQIGNDALRVLQPSSKSLVYMIQHLIPESETVSTSNHVMFSGQL